MVHVVFPLPTSFYRFAVIRHSCGRRLRQIFHFTEPDLYGASEMVSWDDFELTSEVAGVTSAGWSPSKATLPCGCACLRLWTEILVAILIFMINKGVIYSDGIVGLSLWRRRGNRCFWLRRGTLTAARESHGVTAAWDLWRRRGRSAIREALGRHWRRRGIRADQIWRRRGNGAERRYDGGVGLENLTAAWDSKLCGRQRGIQ